MSWAERSERMSERGKRVGLRAITDELLATFGIFRADAAGHGVDGAVLLKREPGGDEAAAAEGGFTTTTPSERPLMIRLRMGKCRGPEAFRARIPK